MLPRRTSLPSAACNAAAARLLSLRFWDFHFVHLDFLTSTHQSCKERIKWENIEYNWSFEDIFMSLEVIYGSPTLNLGDGDAYLGFRNWPHARVLHSLTEQSEIFFAFNKMKWNYISGLWPSLLPFQVGQEAMFCNSGTTLLYLVLHFFYLAHKLLSSRKPFFYWTFLLSFYLIISSMFNWASMLHSSHIFLIWFEGHSISVLMILNHLVGNKICILCNFIPYSCARLHSGLLMISATALGHPLSFNFHPPSFLSLWMKMKNKQRPHDNCNCIGHP